MRNHDLACRRHVSACSESCFWHAKSCFGMQNHDLACRKHVSACKNHVSACKIMIWHAESMFRHAINHVSACRIMIWHAEIMFRHANIMFRHAGIVFWHAESRFGMQKPCYGMGKPWEINGKSTGAPPGPPALGCRQGLQNKAFWYARPARRSHPRRRPEATGRPPGAPWAKSLFRHTKTMCRHANS